MGPNDDRPQFMEDFQFWASSLPAPVYFILGIVGAIAGFVYGVMQPEHHPQYLFAIYGGFGGMILIPLLAAIIRFFIYCVLIGLLGLAFWYAFFKP